MKRIKLFESFLNEEDLDLDSKVSKESAAAKQRALNSKLRDLVTNPRTTVPAVKAMIERGADVNATFSYGSLLYYAARYGNNPMVCLFLINQGLDVNAENRNNNTPLFAAVLGRSLNAANVLIDNGANVNHRGDGGKTPIYHAIGRGDLEMCELLIESGAQTNMIDNERYSPLSYAMAHNADIDIVRLLLNQLPEINISGPDGNTILHFAVFHNYINDDYVKLIIELGGDIHKKNIQGQTPWDMATNSMQILVPELNPNPAVEM